MRVVVTPAEMGAIDDDAPEPVEELIERAGWAVAVAAQRLLGRRYGARVLVIAGKGNNGADGRSAARYLERIGVRCRIVSPAEATATSSELQRRRYDLLIDAAYGTGFRGEHVPPVIGDIPVLAVDIPSGVDGLTGRIGGEALGATETVTFAALKPGLLFEPGRSLAGHVRVVDIGLDCSRARAWHLGADDLAASWPTPEPTTHKWRRAVWVIGGSLGLDGAPALAAAGSARGGAGYVALSTPPEAGPGPVAGERTSFAPIEAVRLPLSPTTGSDRGWSDTVLDSADRFAALVIGPGLSVDDGTGVEVRAVVSATAKRALPLVLDGGAIDAVAADPRVLADRAVPAVLTPHDGEFARLVGAAPGPDRIAAARSAAGELQAVVALKGPTTVVAHPDGRALISTAGDRRLASAGTGDVLAGLVGAGLAGGLDPFLAAGLGAELHGRAAQAGFDRGFVASDLPALVARSLDDLAENSDE
ncbi:MAG: NAD(P)H-hydrate dehydratase [Acidimicrobiales bacterium]